MLDVTHRSLHTNTYMCTYYTTYMLHNTCIQVHKLCWTHHFKVWFFFLLYSITWTFTHHDEYVPQFCQWTHIIYLSCTSFLCKLLVRIFHIVLWQKISKAFLKFLIILKAKWSIVGCCCHVYIPFALLFLNLWVGCSRITAMTSFLRECRG